MSDSEVICDEARFPPISSMAAFGEFRPTGPSFTLGDIWPFADSIPLTDDIIMENTLIHPSIRAIRIHIGEEDQLVYFGDDTGYPLPKHGVDRLRLEIRSSGMQTLPIGRALIPGYPIFYFFLLRPGNRYVLSFRQDGEVLWLYGEAREFVELARVRCICRPY